jgi:hypothetical protein
MSQLPKFGDDGVGPPPKNAHLGHERNSITELCGRAKVDCDGMDVEPAILCDSRNGIRGDANLFQVV